MYQRKIIQEVPMVESQAANQIKKKINLPAAVFNRQGREVQNNSMMSNRPPTPTRKQGMVSPNKIRPDKSLRASNIQQRNANVLACTNHPTKVAQFIIQSQDEQFPYCQKCSILLASQGFKLIKLQQEVINPLDYIQNHERRQQISGFLNKLDETHQYMSSYKQQIQTKIVESHQNLSQNVQQVQQYYQFLIQSIERHKAETIQLLSQHVQQSQTQVKSALQTLNQCLQGSQQMKEDIIGSIQIIKDARQDKFRPVMEAYYERISNFHQCIEQIKDCNIIPTSLAFNDIQEVVKQSTDLIQIAFNENETQENYDGTHRTQSNQCFSFQEEPEEQFKGKGSKIFPQKQMQNGYQNPLRASNIAKSRIGDSLSPLQ